MIGAVYIRSLLFDGDINSKNEFVDMFATGMFGDSSLPIEKGGISQTGYMKNPWPVGLSIIWSPLVLIIFLSYQLFHLFRPEIISTGFETPYQLAVAVSSGIFTLIFLNYSVKSLELYSKYVLRMEATHKALIISLISIFATPIIFYSILSPSFSHIYGAGILAWITYLILELEFSKKQKMFHLPLLGFLFGLFVVIKLQHILFIPLIIYLFSIIYGENPSIKTLTKNLCLFIIPFGLVLLPQLVTWNTIYGTWFTVPQQQDGRDFFAFNRFNILYVLFFPLNGMVMHPFILIGFFGSLWQSIKDILNKKMTILAPLVISVITQLFLLNFMEDWHGSYGFGNRRMVDYTILSSFGILILCKQIKFKYLILLGILLVLLNIIALYFAYKIGFNVRNLYLGL